MSAALSALFAAGVGYRNLLYDREILRQHRLAAPVISVGNLSVGGSGKTPFVMLLCRLLGQRGIDIDVLSRGYGRLRQEPALVDHGGSPADFGDEPLLLARKLQVPVVVGAERYRAGLVAEALPGRRLHLLDDGFQHRQLARDFDVVLVLPEDARDRMLPSGRLREPLAALKRADAVVLPSGAQLPHLPVSPHQLLWRIRRGILFDDLPARPVVFCGIARPENFFLQLEKVGVQIAARASYRDHHRYSARDISELQSLKQRAEGDGFITTEKDLINLGPLEAELRPLSIIRISMHLEGAEQALDSLFARLRLRRPDWFLGMSEVAGEWRGGRAAESS